MRRVILIIAIFFLGYGSSILLNFFLSVRHVLPSLRVADITHEATSTAVLGENVSEESVKVTRVIDGDTIEIEGGKRVRYIGIDTPETVDPRKPVECFGREASEENRRLVDNKTVRLEKDVSQVDRYGRLLRYVYIDDVMINEALVRGGFAHSSTFPPDVKYQDQFRNAEQEARENGRGLWGGCSINNLTNTTNGNTGVGQSASTCIIKGNISTNGEKIYHLPGCGSYEKTSIDESRGERWFCSEDEAQKEGWRKAKNCL